jgi:hypothetical protein
LVASLGSSDPSATAAAKEQPGQNVKQRESAVEHIFEEWSQCRSV